MLTTRSYSDSDISHERIDERFFFCESISGIINDNIYVGVSEFKIGRELITDSLRPCQGVLAKLKNGEYGLYHAFTKSQNESFKNFVLSIQDIGVEFVIVFQKNEPNVNKEKAPYLAINLAECLGDCKVKRVHYEHTGIYVNADTKQVFLFNHPQYVGGDTTKIMFENDLVEINLEQKQISIKESVNTILSESKGAVTLSDGSIRFPDNFKIEGRFLSKSVSIPATRSDTNSKSELTFSDKKNTPTISGKDKKSKTRNPFKHTLSQKNIFSRSWDKGDSKNNDKTLINSNSEKKKNKGLKIFTINGKEKKKTTDNKEHTESNETKIITREKFPKK